MKKCPECGAMQSVYSNGKYFECFICLYWTTGTFDIYDARKLTKE